MSTTTGTRKQRFLVQLLEWENGTSKHNEIDDTCCPDFSCCRNDIRTSEHDRKEFTRAYLDSDPRALQLLQGFYQRAFGPVGLQRGSIRQAAQGSRTSSNMRGRFNVHRLSERSH